MIIKGGCNYTKHLYIFCIKKEINCKNSYPIQTNKTNYIINRFKNYIFANFIRKNFEYRFKNETIAIKLIYS